MSKKISKEVRIADLTVGDTILLAKGEKARVVAINTRPTQIVRTVTTAVVSYQMETGKEREAIFDDYTNGDEVIDVEVEYESPIFRLVKMLFATKKDDTMKKVEEPVPTIGGPFSTHPGKV